LAVKQEGFRLNGSNIDSAPAGATCYQTSNEGQPAPIGWPFCVNEEKDVTNQFGDGRSEVRRGIFKVYNGRHVPTAIEVRYNGRLAIRGQVQDIEPLTPGQNDDYPQPPAQASIIPADVMAGRILDKPQPKYPGAAKMKHITGSVTLEAIIDKQGAIRNLEVIASPDPELAKAAVTAVQRWRYTPYLIKGEATEVDTTIRVNFNMK
jgi:TonB family protein